MKKIKKFDISNPLSGLSVNQIILLLEKGSGESLSERERRLAILAISDHIRFVPEATVESSIYALSRVDSLKHFASVANKLFLGGMLSGLDIVEAAV